MGKNEDLALHTERGKRRILLESLRVLLKKITSSCSLLNYVESFANGRAYHNRVTNYYAQQCWRSLPMADHDFTGK
jgi:hypothetical protein